jgi:hypothetical protein
VFARRTLRDCFARGVMETALIEKRHGFFRRS